MAAAGDPPDMVWRDRDRVRDQYRQAVDYALRVVTAYAARHAADPPLMIVVGDHQAAGFVALDDRFDVPVHVIGPPDLVARVASWGWAPGLLPDADPEAGDGAGGAAPRGMDTLRDMILTAFSDPPAPEPGS
jgi:hypothetical protein